MKRNKLTAGMCMLAALLLPACAGPRHIRPVPVNTQLCRQPFSSTACRYIHRLEARLPGGGRMTVMGISVIDPAADRIQAALLSLEGLTLFDATEAGQQVQVHRAVPPFDGPEFAMALLRDVRFIFMPPSGAPSAAGILDDGSTICRYHDEGGGAADVIALPKGGWEIEQHSASGTKLRSVKISPLKNGYPAVLAFEAFRPRPYGLHMELISAEPVIADGEKR